MKYLGYLYEALVALPKSIDVSTIADTLVPESTHSGINRSAPANDVSYEKVLDKEVDSSEEDSQHDKDVNDIEYDEMSESSDKDRENHYGTLLQKYLE